MVQPNSEFWLLLDWSLDPNWYIYAQNPGDGGLPPTLEFELPPGVTVLETLWPKAQDLSKEGMTIYGYKDTCQTFVHLKASPDYKENSLNPIKLALRWGVCHDQCMVDTATLELRLPTKEVFDMALFDRFHNAENSLHLSDGATQVWLLLLFSMLGGVLLNLMPCVLPVLSLKLLDFAKLRDASSGGHPAIRMHALFYTAGVLATFQILNITLMLLRLFGQHVGWGFQLQSPIFIVCLACLFLALTLNLFGVFEIGLSALRLEEKSTGAQQKSPWVESFLKGVLACIVATPCSAPFMGTAIAASLVQPFWVNTCIFAGLGIGLSLPFLCLVAWPRTITYLPKPGIWMQSLKQFMGFLMMGSVGWMLWILNARFADGLSWILVGLWSLSLGLWFYGKLCSPINPPFKRAVGAGLLALCSAAAMGSFYCALDEKVPTKDVCVFQPYSQAAVDAALAEGHPVLINFTARWCVTCQTNKKFVLESKAVADRLKEDGSVLFEADWTHHDAVITKKLESFGQNSIPFLVYYPKAKGEKRAKPVFLSSMFTETQVIKMVSGK